MRMYDLRVSTASDIAYPIKSYKNFTVNVENNNTEINYTSTPINGNFPILTRRTSQCCRENNGHIRSKQVIIPPTR
jgi:hypothetical protein